MWFFSHDSFWRQFSLWLYKKTGYHTSIVLPCCYNKLFNHCWIFINLSHILITYCEVRLFNHFPYDTVILISRAVNATNRLANSVIDIHKSSTIFSRQHHYVTNTIVTPQTCAAFSPKVTYKNCLMVEKLLIVLLIALQSACFT